MPPLVSVVMPAYNCERFIRETIDSVLAQTLDDFEFLILDDGSTDGTAAVIKRYDDPRIRFFPMAHVGIPGALSNVGLRLARGRFVAHHNADDVYEPTKLARQVAFLDENPEVGAVFTHVRFVDGENQPISPDPIPFNLDVPREAIVTELLKRNFLCASSAMIRKSVIDEVGGFNAATTAVDDYEFWLRIASRHALDVIREPLHRYRLYGGNLSTAHPSATVMRDTRFSQIAYRLLDAIPTGIGQTPRDSVVVVTYNSMATLGACLIGAVAAAPAEGLELIVVDNQSTDDTPRLLTFLEHSLAHTPIRYKVILNRANEGFTHASNQGIQAATGDRVLLLNPDAQLFSGAIARMRAHFAPGVGAVGPTSDYVAGLQKAGIYVEPAQRGKSIAAHDLDTHLARRNSGKVVESRLLVGFCLMISRQALEHVGPLDDALFLGNDDLEYSWRLREHGYVLRIASDVFAHHRGQVSFKTREKTDVDRLVQDSTNMLASKLVAHYGAGKVPTPRAMWGIDWFQPSPNVLAWPVPALPEDAPVASLVVLTLNQLEVTKQCFESLFAHTGPSFELLVIDNGSTDGTRDYLQTLAAREPRVTVILNERNMGFAYGCNQGLAIARGHFLVLLNNDTVVTDGWLEGLIAPMQRDPGLGAVGPRTNRIVGPQQINDVPYQDMAGMAAFAANRREKLQGQGTTMHRLIGFCMAIRREAALAIGGLDPRFGTGNFEDDDYSLRLQVAGYKLWIAEDAFVHHWGSQTFKGEKIDFSALMKENAKLFAHKWGLDPQTTGKYKPAELANRPFRYDRDYVPLPAPDSERVLATP